MGVVTASLGHRSALREPAGARAESREPGTALDAHRWRPRRSRSRGPAGIFLLVMWAALVAAPSHAATITVDTTDDELNSDGDCSLREAIQAANIDAAVDSCTAGSGADLVSVPAGTHVLTLAGLGEDANATGDLDLLSEVVIQGAGSGDCGDPGVTCVDGNAQDRAFEIHVGATVEISALTIRNGDLVLRGGGIHNSGDLTVTAATVTENSASEGGAGIFSDGVLDLSASTISQNALTGASGTGGGFCIFGGSATLTNCTVSGNSAFAGGGLAFMSLVEATVTSCTVSGNSASTGGGIANLGLSVTLADTIVANSTGVNCAGVAPLDGGNNLDDDGTCPRVAAITGLDPALADNGGPNRTHALLAGSSGLDAAGSCGLATDQRGAPRPASLCDSGAFEVQTPSCGSGFVDHGEQCDDGNTSDGDCCSATCQFQDALGVGGTPNCCSAGVCQTGVGCGVVCFTPGAICEQPGGAGTPCTCELP